MEKFPKFIKDVAKVIAVSTVGLLPGQLKGQEVIKIGKNKENTEQLSHKIFDSVEKGYKNGVLRNSSSNAYFYRFQNNEYDVSYDLDSNFDGKKDDIPTIQVDYIKGNSHYLIEQNPIGAKNMDIVCNFKDNSLSDAQTKPYGNFAAEKMLIIAELTEDLEHPVHYREINEEEKTHILNNIEQYFGCVDSTGIKENQKNIKESEVKKETENQKELQEQQVIKSAKQLFEYLKNNDNYKKLEADPISLMKVVSKGSFVYKFDNYYLDLSFIDGEGNKNEIRCKMTDNPYLSKARKIIKMNDDFNIQNLSNEEVQKIIDNAFSLIH